MWNHPREREGELFENIFGVEIIVTEISFKVICKSVSQNFHAAKPNCCHVERIIPKNALYCKPNEMIWPILSKAIGIDNKLISCQTHQSFDAKFRNEGFAKNQLLW